MVEFPKIPTRIQYSGDEAKARKLVGLGRKRFSDLTTALGFQELEHGFNTLEMSDGSTIKTSQSYGLSKIEIYAPEQAEEIPPEDVEVETKDLRFFVRVGRPEDIIKDEWTGLTIEDYTRYYWVDFYSGEDQDEIKFYAPGAVVSSKQDVTSGAIIETRAPSASRGTFLGVIEPPPYMNDVEVKAFDFPYKDNDEEDQTQRMVCGFHYLAMDREIKISPDPQDLNQLTGCALDKHGYTLCPQNRVFYDLESGTIAWYNVAQEWFEGPLGQPPEHSESTGAISILFGTMDFKYVDYGDQDNIPEGVEKEWLFEQRTSLSFIGEKCKDFGFSDASWGDGLYEPVGITADIVSLNREEIKLHVPYQQHLYEFTAEGTNASFGITACEEIGAANSLILVWDGTEETTSAQFVSDDVAYSYDPDPALSDAIWYTVTDCPTIFNQAECEDAPYQLEYEEWEGQKLNQAWHGFSIDVFFGDEDQYSYNDMYKGENNGMEDENIGVQNHACTWTSPGGLCIGSGAYRTISKRIWGEISGSWGTKVTAYATGHNIYKIEQEDKFVDDVDMLRNVILNWNYAPPQLQDPVIAAGIKTDFEVVKETFNVPAPLYSESASPAGLFEVLTTEWPIYYEIRDPVDMITNGDQIPFTLPALAYVGGSDCQWYKQTTAWTQAETEYPDEMTIVGISETFTASESLAVRYLDDRSTEGSHGLVVSVKSSVSSDSAIYHGGTIDNPDATLVDRLEDIIAALYAQNILGPNEYLYDIGLL